VSKVATIVDSAPHETANLQDEAEPEIEYPVQLAHASQPVLRLAGTVKVICPGRRDLALSDQEWQDLGLLALEEVADAG
jgi:hypothetical protein